MREGKPDVISDLWYKSAVIYNCDVRTFLDSNGDGVGDFRGLQRRLDYLAGLGITALWLMPFSLRPTATTDTTSQTITTSTRAMGRSATSSSSRAPPTSAASASSSTWW
jgi:pullulanase/glycogen debranching enzyme